MNNEFNELLKKISLLPLEERRGLLKFLSENDLDLPDGVGDSIADLVSAFCLSDTCPNCHSKAFRKNGRYAADKSRQRYLCKDCGKTFNDYTGTVLHWLHHKEEFVRYAGRFLEGRTLKRESKDHKVCLETAFNWRHKICQAAAEPQKPLLTGVIESDPTFFAYSEKGNQIAKGVAIEVLDDNCLVPQIKNTADSPLTGRKRGGVKGHPGIGEMQVGVLGSLDSNGVLDLSVMKRGKPTGKAVKEALASKIGEGGEILVSDSERVFRLLVEDCRLSHETINASKKQYVSENGFSLGRVNAFHSKLKRWMRKFNGVATKYLQHYADYFFMKDTLSNPQEIWNIILNSNQVFIPIRKIIELNCLNP